MIKKFLLQLLIDPVHESKLIFHEQENQLENRDLNIFYPVEKNVPILLPKDIRSNNKAHRFDYVKHYERDAQHFDYFEKTKSTAMAHENERLHQTILKHINPNAKTILDIGCGNAWLAKKLCPKNIQVISADISKTNPIKAQHFYPFESHQAIVADAHFLPLKPNSLDCIIASEIVEHIADPKKLIGHLLEKLKPKAELIITTPYNEIIEQNLCIHCHQLTPRHAHLHSFNEMNIKQFLPEGVQWQFQKFNNKYLIKLKTHILLQYFPLSVWNVMDKLSHLILPSPSRLLLKIRKN